MPDVIPPGSTVFIDANIFLYKILEHWKYSEPCTKLLKDVNYGKYSGVTSVFVCRKYSIGSCSQSFSKSTIEAKYSIKYLKDNPNVLRELSAAWVAIENIEQIENLIIVGVGRDVLDLAMTYSKRYGLLSTDAIHTATMKQEGLSILASNDRDFERVDWLKLWSPDPGPKN
jgi:predicted nucleic acid-binding protein